MNFLRRILPGPVKDLLRPIYHGAARVLSVTVRSCLRLLRRALGAQLFLAICHYLGLHADKTYEIVGLKFDAQEPRPLSRAITILTKEPDTIHWINEFVQPGDVFYDIGANIGVFSLYSAKKRGARVFAFEPMCSNYAILNKNIFLNDLSDQIRAFNIAFDSETRLSSLHLSGFVSGKAGHSFAPDTPFETVFKQGVFGITVDALIADFSQPFPTHIKIDVDGNEPRIVDGMQKTLSDPRLKSLAIELGPEERAADQDVINILLTHGFKRIKGPGYENTTSASWTTVRNYFFHRP